MKKTWKKVLVYLTAGVLSLSLLSACKAPELPAENGVQQSGSSTVTNDAVVLTAVIKDMSADDPVSQKYLETVSQAVSREVGKEITIQLAPISDGSYTTSMGLLLQSGDIPDLMYFQGGDYQFAITQGLLADLTPFIENSVYIKQMMQPFNEARISNYPYLLWLSPDRVKVPLVRKDWFEEMDSGQALLDQPTTDNYITFFKEIKEKKGLQAAYTVPGDLTELDTIFNQAFGIDKTWMIQDGTVVYSKVSNAQKEKLAFYAKLYQEELLDKGWLSKKWDTKESAFYNGEVGVVAGTSGSVVNVYNNKMTNQNGEAAGLMVLPPAKGVAQGYTTSDVSKESRGWAISAYSEQQEIAFAVLEYMASPEGQIFDKLGYQGEQYNLENGIYTLTDKIQEWYPRIHESIKTFDVEFAEDTPYFSDVALDSLAAVEQYTTLDQNFILPEEFVINWDAGEALYAEYASDVISGKKSLDSFDQFVREWEALGGKEITAYANKILK